MNNDSMNKVFITMNDMNGGNRIGLCWSRLRVMTLCFMLSMLAYPMYAQNSKEVEKAMKRNESLKQQIKTLSDDNTSLLNKLNENKKLLQQRKNRLQELKIQNERTNISPEQINEMQNKVDSLEKDNNTLKTQYDSLKKVMEKKAAELYGLNLQVSEMGVYSDIETKQQYEQNQALFSKRFSELDNQQVNNLVAHLADFQKMDGYAEFEKKVKFMQQNKKLYDECISALNNKYDAVKVQQLRDQLLPLRENKENKEKGFYKLNTAQFNEIDSTDIRLSRFKGGMGELQDIMKKVNNDPEINRLRTEGKNRNACVEAMMKFVGNEPTARKKEWKNQSVVERYFNMVPYLDKAYKTYKKELSDKPFQTTDIEKEILAFEL